MLTVNISLLRNLPDKLGCTITHFCSKYGIDERMRRRWFESEEGKFNPQVTHFVEICNKIHLAPSQIIQSDMDFQTIPDTQELFPIGREWKPVRFDQDAFLSFFGRRGPLGMATKDMMIRLKKTYEAFRQGWSNPGESCTLRLNDLFLFCDTFNIDINKILIDPQGKIYSEAIGNNQDETVKRLKQRERKIRELAKELEAIKAELTEERKARMLAEDRVGKLVEELGANNWNFVSEKAAENQMG